MMNVQYVTDYNQFLDEEITFTIHGEAGYTKTGTDIHYTYRITSKEDKTDPTKKVYFSRKKRAKIAA